MNKKVAIVTGSSGGIGASIVLKLAKNGFNVVINYCHSKDKALKLKEYVEKEYQVKALVIKADLQQEDEIKALVYETINTFGRIDCLVNNAAIAIDTLVEDKTKDNFLKTLDVNLVGPFLMCRYVAFEMMKKQKGIIINITSTNGIDTYYPMSLDYDASKAGLISLTHNLAKHYAPYIRVNAVAPGWTNTEMNQYLDAEFKKEEEAKIFLKRFAEPEEIANVVAFLASDDASYINNTIIRVDGGY